AGAALPALDAARRCRNHRRDAAYRDRQGDEDEAARDVRRTQTARAGDRALASVSAQQAVAIGPRAPAKGPGRSPRGARLRDADVAWAAAFLLPYAAVFLAFVVYPFGYALWLARDPELYADL